MPGPGYTSPNNPNSKRSELLREIYRKRFGDYGSNRRDLNNRHDRKPKAKRAPYKDMLPWKPGEGGGGNGDYVGPHRGWRA